MNVRASSTCLLITLAMLEFAGCGSPGIPRPPSLNLPQPVSDLRAVRKGDRVYLSWTVPTQTTDSTTLRGLGSTLVCRSLDLEMTECHDPAGRVAAPSPSTAPLPSSKVPAPKVGTGYMDELSTAVLSGNPSARLFYSVSATNQRGRSAGLSNLTSVSGFVSTAPPPDFAAKVTGEGVILSWAGSAKATESAGVERLYRVYRREDGSNTDAIAGEQAFMQAPSFQSIDRTFDWEKKYDYRVTVVTRIRLEGKPTVEFEGDDSNVAHVFAHDIFPPAMPSGLQAAYSSVGNFIDLIWAPDVDADLAGYNVYRHEANGKTEKINTVLLTAPAFRDPNVASGHSYVYSVTAVDVRRNESAASGEANETVP